MTMKHTLTAVAAIATLTAGAAQAELSFGGFAQIESFNGYCPCIGDWENIYNDLRGEVSATYQFDRVTIGAGLKFETELGEDDFEFEPEENLFFLLNSGAVTLTHGSFYGAGNMLSEDYFLMDDTTEDHDKTLRVDLEQDGLHIALSVPLDDTEEWELGVATQAFGHFLRLGYEADSQDLGVIIGRDMGRWGYHLTTLQDLDDNGWGDDQIGATLLVDLTDDLRVAGNVNYATENLELMHYSLAAWYQLSDDKGSLGPVTLYAEYNKDLDWDEQYFSVGIDIAFGNQAPAAYERRERKEFVSGFGFY